jgi:hypothetical protein
MLVALVFFAIDRQSIGKLVTGYATNEEGAEGIITKQIKGSILR